MIKILRDIGFVEDRIIKFQTYKYKNYIYLYNAICSLHVIFDENDNFVEFDNDKKLVTFLNMKFNYRQRKINKILTL